MARRLLISASALVLGLTAFTVACAEQRDPRYAVPYSYDSRSDSQVRSLAREVDDTAARIYREYARNNRRPDRDEREVLDRLNELSGRADRFSDGARDYRYDSRYDNRYDSRNDSRYDRRGSRVDDQEFRALVDAFFRTQNALRYIQRRPYVDDGMDRIASRLRELSRYYGGYDQFDRYDRYDRDDRGRHNGRYRNN